MGIETYLGNPPQHIVDWIKSHSTPSEPTAPNGKVLYKTSPDGEWLQSEDINVSSSGGTFPGFNERNIAVAVILPNKDINGNDIIEIGMSTFYNSSELTSVTIPSGVTSIGGMAFMNCSKLKSVTISNSMTYISSGVFDNCSSLTSITFLGKTLEEVQNIEDGNGNKNYPWGISDTRIITVA